MNGKRRPGSEESSTRRRIMTADAVDRRKLLANALLTLVFITVRCGVKASFGAEVCVVAWARHLRETGQ